MKKILQQGITTNQLGHDNTEYVLIGLLAVIAGGIFLALLKNIIQSAPVSIEDGLNFLIIHKPHFQFIFLHKKQIIFEIDHNSTINIVHDQGIKLVFNFLFLVSP